MGNPQELSLRQNAVIYFHDDPFFQSNGHSKESYTGIVYALVSSEGEIARDAVDAVNHHQKNARFYINPPIGDSRNGLLKAIMLIREEKPGDERLPFYENLERACDEHFTQAPYQKITVKVGDRSHRIFIIRDVTAISENLKRIMEMFLRGEIVAVVFDDQIDKQDELLKWFAGTESLLYKGVIAPTCYDAIVYAVNSPFGVTHWSLFKNTEDNSKVTKATE